VPTRLAYRSPSRRTRSHMRQRDLERVRRNRNRPGGPAGYPAFIREHHKLVAEDTQHAGSIVPIRDDVMTALRIE
jgi:hypothetical protein